MHRCLGIVEVQRFIFRQTLSGSTGDTERPEHGGQATVAGLARTCRIFSNVALDVLWEDLRSFAYLIQCLPSDLWKIDEPSKRMTFQRPMSLNDWAIFSRYASRVRSMSDFPFVNRHSCRSLSSDVIFALSRPPHHGALVPYLKTLCWRDSSKKYEPLLQLLLAPSLVDITLPCFALHSPATSIQLTSRCPSLKHVRIDNAKHASVVQDADHQRIASETILRLPSLKSLECHVLDEAAIIHLSQLPSLTKLLIHLQDSKLENLKPYLTPPAFASLESLSLVVDTLSTSTSLLEAMQFKPREVIARAGSLIPYTLHPFFTSLVKSCDFGRLSRIVLFIYNNRRLPSVERQEISLSTFQPLLSLHNVTNFRFDAMCSITLDDDAIKTLAKHWPKLAHLALNPRSGWGVKSRVTHQGLITLLSDCPDLGYFALAVDFSEIDRSHSQLSMSRPGNGITSHCRKAGFIESAINHPITIAAFLSDVCPRLGNVTTHWGRDADMAKYADKWNEVNDLLPAFQAVRTQCNEWHKGRE